MKIIILFLVIPLCVFANTDFTIIEEQIQNLLETAIKNADTATESQLKENYKINIDILSAGASQEDKEIIKKAYLQVTKAVMISNRLKYITEALNQYLISQKSLPIEQANNERIHSMLMTVIYFKSMKGLEETAQEYENIADEIKDKIIPNMQNKYQICLDEFKKIKNSLDTKKDQYKEVGLKYKEIIEMYLKSSQGFKEASKKISGVCEELKNQTDFYTKMTYLVVAHKALASFLLAESERANKIVDEISQALFFSRKGF